MHLQIYCDGAARGNPGPAAFGFVVKDQQGRILYRRGQFIGRATNNEAEYQAVIDALNFLGNLSEPSFDPNKKTWTIDVRMDSQLVAEQLNGHFKVREERMRNLLVKVREEQAQFGAVSFSWIPRHENKEADFLANQALDERS